MTADNRVTSTVLGLLLCAASAAQAQTSGAARPSRGLFGGAAAADQSVNLTISLVEAFDDNLQADVTSVSPTNVKASGFYTGLAPTLDFASRGQRVRLNATMGSNLRYYREGNRLVSVGHSAAAGLSARIARRTTLSLSQSVSYAPTHSRLSGLFASVAAPGSLEGLAGDSAVNPATDSAVNQATDRAAGSGRSYSSGTTLGIAQAVGRRSTLSFSSGFRYATFGGEPGYSDQRSYEGGVRFSHTVTRDAALRLGYTFRQASYSKTNRPTTHDINVGIDYQWPLTRTRRTIAAFSMGSTIVDGPLQEFGTATGETRRQFRALGDASLTHQMGRTWRLQGAYHRGLGFVDGLTGPVFTDALTVLSDGFVNRRTDVLVSASYTIGDTALTGSASSFNTYVGNIRVRFALSKTWATYGEYLYYLYDFAERLDLPPGMSPHMRRNSARVGLTLWVPVKRW